jgi:hypothetical protein
MAVGADEERELNRRARPLIVGRSYSPFPSFSVV